MNKIEFLNRALERRHERVMAHPPRPRDTRLLVGSLFFVGYYLMVFAIMRGRQLPPENATLVKDAMLVLGPIVGMIAQALFRNDVKDEMQAGNTALGFRAMAKQADATRAAAAAMPMGSGAAGAAEQVADAASDEASRIREQQS